MYLSINSYKNFRSLDILIFVKKKSVPMSSLYETFVFQYFNI